MKPKTAGANNTNRKQKRKKGRVETIGQQSVKPDFFVNKINPINILNILKSQKED